MLDVLGRTGKVFCIQFTDNKSTQQSIKSQFNEIISKAHGNRLYKWNMIFDFGDTPKDITESLRRETFSPVLVNTQPVRDKPYIQKLIKDIII